LIKKKTKVKLAVKLKFPVKYAREVIIKGKKINKKFTILTNKTKVVKLNFKKSCKYTITSLGVKRVINIKIYKSKKARDKHIKKTLRNLAKIKKTLKLGTEKQLLTNGFVSAKVKGKKCVMVDKTGYVKAVKKGTCKIVVKSYIGYKQTYKIKVKK
jgi:hypothetical protein